MSLTVRQLEIIRAVSRYGSVTLASEALMISQPAVSMVLRDATKSSGFPLFERRQGRLQPTAETHILLSEVERVFDSVERINHLIEDMKDVKIGTIRIAATPTLANNLLPAAVQAFHKIRPRIQINIQTVDNLNVTNAVIDQRVDFGVALSPLNVPEVHSILLCVAELVCVVHPKHPLANLKQIAPENLLPYPLISFNKNLRMGNLVERIFKDQNIQRKITFEVDQSSVACSLARTGVGVAIMDPFWLMERSNDIIGIKLRPKAEVTAEALLPKDTPLSRAGKMFLATLRNTAANINFAIK